MKPTTDKKLLPYLFFDNLHEAIPWLADVFGFEERFRLDLPNGVIAHAEIAIGDGAIMLGNVGERNSAQPMSQRGGVYVFVDDVQAHFETAKSKGAEIVQEPTDMPFGDRMYIALDCEGHEWYFAQHLFDIDVDEFKKQLSGGA